MTAFGVTFMTGGPPQQLRDDTEEFAVAIIQDMMMEGYEPHMYAIIAKECGEPMARTISEQPRWQRTVCGAQVVVLGLVRCECHKDPHPEDMPHECASAICGGRWLGQHDTPSFQAVRFPSGVSFE